MDKAVNADDERAIVVIGAGEHARVLLDALALTHPGRVRMVTDDNPGLHGGQVGGVPIGGGDELVLQQDPAEVLLVNAVGSVRQPHARRRVFERFNEAGFDFLTVIHPSAVLAADVTLGEGAQIMAGVVMQTGASIGRDAIVNTSASIDHDCVVGDHAHIAPGVTLSGRVSIGMAAHVGTGASVIQGITIGADALVAAGAVVVRDVPDAATVMGTPARPRPSQTPAGGASSLAFRTPGAFNIMLSAAGRRVALLKLLRRSLRDADQSGKVLASEISRTSAAMHVADAARVVPDYAAPNCLGEMLDLCREYRIRLIVPTIDPELTFYAQHRAAFREIGTEIMVSSAETIEIGNDKQATHHWLVEHSFPSPRQIDADQLRKGMGDWQFPVFVKPRWGSSSRGAVIVRTADELRIAVAQRQYVAQSIASGTEYTVDAYIDRNGRCRCTVPRLRIETRGGEVSKGMTVRCRPVQDVVRRVAEALPGAEGVINIQVFYAEETGELLVTDINPRFGGGYPLTHEAGAPMAQWFIREVAGLPIHAEENQWTNGLVMLRYDEAVFVPRAEAGVPWPVGHTAVGPLHHGA